MHQPAEPNLQGTIMRKLIAVLLFSWLATASTADPITANAQRMLNQLGFDAGPVDGAYGGKTRRALEKFYESLQLSFDGSIDLEELNQLQTEIGKSPHIWTPASINISDRYKYDTFPGLIKIDLLLVRWPWFGYPDVPAIDVTDDGYLDLVLQSDTAETGAGNLEASTNLAVLQYFPAWQEFDLTQPIYSENTKHPSPTMKYADMNNDGRVDIVVSSSYHDGYGNMSGGVFIYFNKGNGTFHSVRISKPGFIHGLEIGDLDNDSDIDILYWIQGTPEINCELNDGSGNFSRTNCLKAPRVGGFLTYKVADFDNDGFTDVAAFGNIGGPKVNLEWGRNINNDFKNPVIFWGDGSASFSSNNATFLDVSQYTDLAYDAGQPYFDHLYGWATVDIGNDGDVDLGASIVGAHAFGSANVIFLNNGNRQFQTKEIWRSPFLSIDPIRSRERIDQTSQISNNRDYIWLTEGLIWNDGCGNWIFSDLNGDGNQDFICGGSSWRKPNQEEALESFDNNSMFASTIPWNRPVDWDPKFSTLNTYAILDEVGTVLDSGQIFDLELNGFSEEFKLGGYQIETLGYDR
jgi:peptidoglycan hydrolase-like protein with peptidoglycan-binding domain